MGNFKKATVSNKAIASAIKMLRSSLSRVAMLGWANLVIFLYVSYVLIFVFKHYFSSEELQFGICMTDACLKAIYEKYPSFIKFNEWAVTTIAILIAARSLKLSRDSYEQSRLNNVFNNHIANKKFFNEHVNSEISKLQYISAVSVDLNIYYSFMFPKSSEGDFCLDSRYSNLILKIRNYLIKTSNDNKKNSEFDYKNHQSKLSKLLLNLGIDLVRLPRRDFYLVEAEIIKLIDSITILLTDLDKRHLLNNVDIHYR